MPASLNITVWQSRQSGVVGRPDQFQAESVLRSSGICTCALASSKKLIVFSCHLECGIKKLISQSVGFDVYAMCAPLRFPAPITINLSDQALISRFLRGKVYWLGRTPGGYSDNKRPFSSILSISRIYPFFLWSGTGCPPDAMNASIPCIAKLLTTVATSHHLLSFFHPSAPA